MGDQRLVRLCGYAPRGSTHADALDRIAAELLDELGDRIRVEVDHNILDRGRQIGDLITDVEAGVATLCFFSTSYLAERVPELGIVDLPYVFGSLDHAHHVLDGALGAALDDATRAATGLVPMGYWDNGFRHLSNRWHEIRRPQDCQGLKVRLQPNWAHEALIRELGAEPVLTDLREGIALLNAGDLDAQENPLSNFVAYGIDRLHPYLSLTAHVYGARGVYASAAQLESWDADEVDALRRAARAGIEQQRVAAAQAEIDLRRKLEGDGLTILELTAEEHGAFREAAAPVLAEADRRFGEELFTLLRDPSAVREPRPTEELP